MANGLTEEEVGLYVDVIMDGRKEAEYKPEQAKKIDLVLRTDFVVPALLSFFIGFERSRTADIPSALRKQGQSH